MSEIYLVIILSFFLARARARARARILPQISPIFCLKAGDVSGKLANCL